MKNFEDMKISVPTGPDQNGESFRTLKRYLDGEKVCGDALLKAGIFLVIEVLRRNETPSFCRNFFRDRLTRALKLGSKYSGLLQVWPGIKEPRPHEVKENNTALGLLKTILDHSPSYEDRLDTSGDI
jgi:hypothetical protein